MFDIGWSELGLIAVVAVVVIGPKDLPKVVRTISALIRQSRRIVNEIRDTFEDVAREAELDALRRELQDGPSHVTPPPGSGVNPAAPALPTAADITPAGPQHDEPPADKGPAE